MRDAVRKLMPGKLSAIAKWELPRTVTALCSYLGFCNYYSTFILGFATRATGLLGKLKASKADDKKSSKMKLVWNDSEKADFEAIKKSLTRTLSPHVINPKWNFVLFTDASNFAVCAVLERVPRVQGMPTLADVAANKMVPVTFI